MIRINLLGVPKKTRGGRRATAAVPSGGGEGSSTVVLGLIFAGALVVLIGVAQMWVQREHDTLEKNLLNLVADTVNSTDAVWLETMTNDGKTLSFTGMALSPNSVADLMANLRKTGAFKTVEIKETLQDAAVKEVQAFKFELNCEMDPSFTGKNH